MPALRVLTKANLKVENYKKKKTKNNANKNKKTQQKTTTQNRYKFQTNESIPNRVLNALILENSKHSK